MVSEMEENNRMENEGISFNQQKAHQLNLKITCFMVALIEIPLILVNGIAESKLYLLAGIGILLCAFFIYFMKLSNMVKAVLFATIPGMVVFALFFLDNFSLNKHYFFFITIIMAAVYFNRKVLITYGLILNVLLIVLYLLAPEKLLGENNSLSNFLTVFFIYNGITYMLNNLNEWGGELVSKSQSREQEASVQLQETKQLVAMIEHSAHTLKSETDEVRNTSNSLAAVSDTILISTQQIAESIQSEADSIFAMHNVMHDSKSAASK